MVSEDKSSDAAIKAGKKILKRQDSGGSMKLKALAKEVATKIDHDCHKTVKKWIKKSDKFDVSECGKHVSLAGSGDAEKKKELKRKRSSLGGNGSSGNDADNKTSGSSKKKSKKDKKQKKEKQSSSSSLTVTSGSALDSSNVDQWRKEQKIVLMDAHDDEDGQKATKVVNANKAY